jgi:hypothetical protein
LPAVFQANSNESMNISIGMAVPIPFGYKMSIRINDLNIFSVKSIHDLNGSHMYYSAVYYIGLYSLLKGTFP